MKIASLVFVILFGLVSFVHLYLCFTEKEKYRKYSKPLCLTFLFLSAVFYSPTDPFVYVGILLGLTGDIFLINKKNIKFFFIGTIAFIGGHILYLLAIISKFSNPLPFWVYLIIFGGLVILALAILPFDHKLVGKLTIIGNLYMPFLLIMLAFGIILMNNNPNPIKGLLVTIGYASFFISDTILIITSFVKDIKRRDFYIMTFYLLAEVLIVVGLLI